MRDNQDNISALDIITVMSFMISLSTLDKTVTNELIDKEFNLTLDDIHKHLNEQDTKLNVILSKLGGDSYER